MPKPEAEPQSAYSDDWAEQAGIAGGWDAIDWQPEHQDEPIVFVDKDGRETARIG